MALHSKRRAMGTGRQSSKKAMRTKRHNNKTAPGLRDQSSDHQQTPAPEQTPERPKLPGIDFARRRANRELATEQLLSLLRNEALRFLAIAEVVGKWIWIQFTEKQPREVTGKLAEFGFHWNNKRQTWQHPCGALIEGTQSNPRAKYPTYFPSDAKPA